MSPSARPSKAVAGGHLGPTATAAATGNTAPMATCARSRHQPAAPSIWKGHAARVSTRRTFFEPRRTTGGCLLHKKAAAAHGQQTSPATNQQREVAFKQPKTSINLHEPIPRHHEYTPKTLPMLQVHQTPTNRSAPMSAPLPQPPRTAHGARRVVPYSLYGPLYVMCSGTSILSVTYKHIFHAPYKGKRRL